jgi:7,8-dihydropterin-6-yl-methyl-4-(beta-D-ribofuranosyl)aminobenzene 5'-phosphate synthase
MSRLLTHALVTALLVSAPAVHASSVQQKSGASQVKVTILSTMLVGNPASGIGEWGFAAVLEADGRRLLIDTGARAETVLKNAAELKVDLSSIADVVITHNHADHTGGLLTLRRELAKQNPEALSRVHVPKGVFYPRGQDESVRRAIPSWCALHGHRSGVSAARAGRAHARDGGRGRGGCHVHARRWHRRDYAGPVTSDTRHC